MRHTFLFIAAVLLLWALGPTRADDHRLVVPLAADAAASQQLLAQATAARRCAVVDLRQGEGGTLLKGASAATLPHGRYRLHALLALAPLGDLNISALTVTIAAGGATRVVTMPSFVVADEFIDLPLDFALATAQEVPVAISWTISGPQAKKNRLAAIDMTKGPDDDAGVDVSQEAYAVAEDGTIAVADLPKIAFHLAGCGVHLERLSPLRMTVTTDKIVYTPGEQGTATATLSNDGPDPVTAVLTAEVAADLDAVTPAGGGTVTLAPGATERWSGPFATAGLHWGAELRVSAHAGTTPPVRARAIFGATTNFWETSISTGMMFSANYKDPAKAEAFMEGHKVNGFTQMESGFWAPDEFGDFTPDQDMFFGGQGCYPGSVQGTKNVINAGHKRGIASTVYSNLWGGDGWESYEMMRQHPDWFSAWGGAVTDWMENWPLMFTGKIPAMPVWPYTCANLTVDGPLKVHATELVNSHRTLGWDGVRYDSYDAVGKWNIDATEITRNLVAKDEPNYRWGYNSSVPAEVTDRNFQVMLHGGQMMMEEGLRSTASIATPAPHRSLAHYCATLNTYRDRVWTHDGHFGLCYDVPQDLHGGTVLDRLYMCSILLACGSHPYYGLMERGFGDYPGFALRYSEFIWDNRMRPLQTPETVITFGGAPKLLEWQKLARRLDLGGGRHRLVLHLLNAPAIDTTLLNQALKLPPPLRALPVTVALPAGATVTGAWTLCPYPTAGHVPVTGVPRNGAVVFTLPEVRIWSVLVIDYQAREGLR